MSYTSTTIVSELTGISESEINSTWLDWADEQIDKKTGMSFTPAVTETLKIDGNGVDMIKLPKKPIIEITQIDIIDSSGSTYTYTGDDLTNNFIFYEEDGVIAFSSYRQGNSGDPSIFPEGTQNILITGKFGYDITPKIVQELATYLVIDIMLTKKPDLAANIKSEKLGDVSVSYNELGPQAIKQKIADLFDQLIKGKITGNEVYFSNESDNEE